MYCNLNQIVATTIYHLYSLAVLICVKAKVRTPCCPHSATRNLAKSLLPMEKITMAPACLGTYGPGNQRGQGALVVLCCVQMFLPVVQIWNAYNVQCVSGSWTADLLSLVDWQWPWRRALNASLQDVESDTYWLHKTRGKNVHFEIKDFGGSAR